MLKLLPRDLLVRTGACDRADWSYRPLLGWIQRKRFHLVLRLLEGQRYRRLCEVGYGSAIFLPALADLSDELYGIDIHDRTEAVARSLAQVGVTAQLFTGSVTSMPFEDGFFDAVVMISSLEYVNELDRACAELKRVMSEQARLIIVTPGDSPLLDFGLRLLTGEDPARGYGDRRGRIESVAKRSFRPVEVVRIPQVGGKLLRLYTGLRLETSRGV